MDNGQTDKNAINIKKHGISFVEAAEVFNDPNAIEFYDIDHSTAEEDRYQVLGDIGNCLIVLVVYTDRNGFARIISARPAEPKEEAVYYEHIKKAFGRN